MSADPVTVGPGARVRDVVALMNRHRVGSVMVVEGDALRGIFTERDFIKRIADAVPGWRDYPVSDWMTADPHTIPPDADWDDAVGRMSRLRVRHLPVIDAGRVVGMVSARQLMARRDEVLSRRVDERTALLRAANDQLLARDAEVLFNLRAAGRLQRKALLPQAPPPWPELRWAVYYAPLDYLGGDYYDYATPTPDKLGFLIADASGHSVPAAMVAVMARFAFAEAARTRADPGAVLGVMNRRLHELNDERFVTAFYAVLDRRTGELRYAAAGHPHPAHYRAATGDVKPLTAAGFLLGIMPDEVYAEGSVTLAAGDKIVFFTDGVMEARDEIGDQFGTARLFDAVRNAGHLGAGGVLTAVRGALNRFTAGTPLTDDVTVVVAEVAGAADGPPPGVYP